MALPSAEQSPLINGLLKMGLLSKNSVQVPDLLIVSSCRPVPNPGTQGHWGVVPKASQEKVKCVWDLEMKQLLARLVLKFRIWMSLDYSLKIPTRSSS